MLVSLTIPPLQGITLPPGMMLLPGVIRLGHTRVSLFGFFAAAGLIAAIALSQRTARLAGVDPEKLWDAGVFAVFSAFVLSRALLIVQDFPAFLRYPLLMLSLPSLTFVGLCLTATAVIFYLRLKQLSLKLVLDAWAPCGALLAAVLALAHFVEGTDAGMPTSLPWGVLTPGDTVLGKVHPVQIYIVIVALALKAASYRALLRPHKAGRVGAWTLVAGSVAALLLMMLMQPTDSHATIWLEQGQIAWAAAMLVGAMILGEPEDPQPTETQNLEPQQVGEKV